MVPTFIEYVAVYVVRCSSLMMFALANDATPNVHTNATARISVRLVNVSRLQLLARRRTVLAPGEQQAQRRAARRRGDQPRRPVHDRHGDAEQRQQFEHGRRAAHRGQHAGAAPATYSRPCSTSGCAR